MTALLLDQILERLRSTDPSEYHEIARRVERATLDMAWVPNPGPQFDAYHCDADELFYGGQAGGGKTQLGLGLALTAHRHSLILRRINKDAVKLVERVAEILGHRAEGWWRLREELDPDQQFGSMIALPPDASIKADLAAPRWELTPRGIKVEDKSEIRKRLGRSPDDGDAIVMCLSEGAKAAMRQIRRGNHERRPERANVGYAELKARLRGW